MRLSPVMDESNETKIPAKDADVAKKSENPVSQDDDNDDLQQPPPPPSTVPARDFDADVLLPEGFVPSEHDVICGRSRSTSYHATGNRRFRDILDKNVGPYLAAQSKDEKSQVVVSITMQVQTGSKGDPGGNFVRKVEGKAGSEERWMVLSHKDVRDKVSHAIRKAVQKFEQDCPDAVARMRTNYGGDAQQPQAPPPRKRRRSNPDIQAPLFKNYAQTGEMDMVNASLRGVQDSSINAALRSESNSMNRSYGSSGYSPVDGAALHHNARTSDLSPLSQMALQQAMEELLGDASLRPDQVLHLQQRLLQQQQEAEYALHPSNRLDLALRQMVLPGFVPSSKPHVVSSLSSNESSSSDTQSIWSMIGRAQMENQALMRQARELQAIQHPVAAAANDLSLQRHLQLQLHMQRSPGAHLGDEKVAEVTSSAVPPARPQPHPYLQAQLDIRRQAQPQPHHSRQNSGSSTE